MRPLKLVPLPAPHPQVLPSDANELLRGIHGTVSHMPPEAMRDTVFSLATDVYSFGIVLWELVTQDRPFSGMAAHQVRVCMGASTTGTASELCMSLCSWVHGWSLNGAAMGVASCAKWAVPEQDAAFCLATNVGLCGSWPVKASP